MKEFFLKDEYETKRLGSIIGGLIFSGFVLCLNGDLGAGKTTMTKSIAKSLGIEEDITSPTFNIVNEYDSGKLKLNHFDVYRIGSSEEMYDIGYDEYVYGEDVSIIEWSSIIEDVLPDERLEVYLSYEDMGRIARIIAYGNRYEDVLDRISLD